ncbi:MAG: proton-conducting transporter membrane subunit [Bacillota bacterium]
MVNPGLIYLLGLVGGSFFKNKYLEEITAVVISVLGLIITYNLSISDQLVVSLLDFEVVLLEVTLVSKIIGVTFALFGLLSIIYSLTVATRNFYRFYYIYLAGSMAILFVGDLFSFYICWELMTISSFFLIINNNQAVTNKTGYFYFMMHLVGAMSLLLGILIQYQQSGSMELVRVEYGLIFFILAVGIKLAAIGFHTWLPRSYSSASFYVSVLLSAYTTKVGVYALYRLLGTVELLGYIGVATAVIGVFLALQQSQLRKLLSYHIVSQIGYMIVAVSLGTELGELGSFLHLVNNILYKGLLFMVVGVIIYTTGTENLLNLGGLRKKLPLTTCYLLVAALAIGGTPLFSGYISKSIIKKAVDNSLLSWGLHLANIGTLLSFLKVIYFGFIQQNKQLELKKRPTTTMLISMGLVSIVIILLGIKPYLITRMLGIEIPIKLFTIHSLWGAIEPTLLAFLIFKVGYDWIKPHQITDNQSDIYSLLGVGVKQLAFCLQRLQNGNLSRYLLWLLTTLVLLLIGVMI